VRIGDPLSCDYAPSSTGAFDSKALSPPRRCSQCTEYSSRVSDLETRLTLATDKASNACGLMKWVSVLDDKVSSLTMKIVHHEECDSYVIGIIESVCEMLRCKIPCDFSFFLWFHCCIVTLFVISGTCLDYAAEARRVAERNAALEKSQRAWTACGLILDAVVLLCCSRTAPSISESLLMAAKELL
jgi:hypothetical protein